MDPQIPKLESGVEMTIRYIGGEGDKTNLREKAAGAGMVNSGRLRARRRSNRYLQGACIGGAKKEIKGIRTDKKRGCQEIEKVANGRAEKKGTKSMRASTKRAKATKLRSL